VWNVLEAIEYIYMTMEGHIELAVWIFIPSCVWFSQPSPYPHIGVSSRTTNLYSVWILPILVYIRHDEWIGSGPRSYHGWEIPEVNGGCNGKITGKYGKIEQISL
jgi:hypothetical protein